MARDLNLNWNSKDFDQTRFANSFSLYRIATMMICSAGVFRSQK